METGCYRHAKPHKGCKECERKQAAEKDPFHSDNITKPGSPLNTILFS